VLFSGIIAIWLAFLGFGIWSLIAQLVLKSLFSLFFFNVIHKKRIGWGYCHKSIKVLYKFGSNILYGSILNNLVNNFSTLVIGKIYATKELGFFSRGTQFTDVLYNSLSSI